MLRQQLIQWIWEAFARKSADIHESLQLIHYYLYLKLERVKKEWQKLENIFLDLHILPIIFKDAFDI